MLTGYGCFDHYLHRIGRLSNRGCWYCANVEMTPPNTRCMHALDGRMAGRKSRRSYPVAICEKDGGGGHEGEGHVPRFHKDRHVLERGGREGKTGKKSRGPWQATSTPRCFVIACLTPKLEDAYGPSQAVPGDVM